MNKIFERPKSLINVATHYCSGCAHGIIHRIVAEAIDELGIQGDLIGVGSVGCSVFIYDYIDCDFVQAPHGRAPAVATGIKRSMPKSVVFTYQGDGDLAAIGSAEVLHAAIRGENITIIFVNNAIYGMTGGQMAPTTIINQVTQTTPNGRNASEQGYPAKMCEIFAAIEGVAYAERVSVHDIKNIHKSKNAIKKAFQVQMANKGFSIVEVLATCPTNWGMTPKNAMAWLEENMISCYPLGNYKNIEV